MLIRVNSSELIESVTLHKLLFLWISSKQTVHTHTHTPLEHFIVGVAPLLNKAIQHLQWWSWHYPFFLAILQPLLPLRQPLHRCLVHCLRCLLPQEERGCSGKGQVEQWLIRDRSWGLAARARREHPKLARIFFWSRRATVQVVIDGCEAWMEGPGVLEGRGRTPVFSTEASSPPSYSITPNTAGVCSGLRFIGRWNSMVVFPGGASGLDVGVALVLCLKASQSLSGVTERRVEASQAW